MSPGLRSLGSILFLMGGLAVVVGLVGAWRFEGQEQASQAQLSLAFALLGGLAMVGGIVADWLGVNPTHRDQPTAPRPNAALERAKPVERPPAMRLSSRPAGGKGYREDLMA